MEVRPPLAEAGAHAQRRRAARLRRAQRSRGRARRHARRLALPRAHAVGCAWRPARSSPSRAARCSRRRGRGICNASPADASSSVSARRSRAISKGASAWRGLPRPRACATTCARCAPIFARWQDGTPLAFESAHYRLTRMQPYFDPGPLEQPRLPIWLGAVNPGMTRVAGEVADGVLMHPTNSDPRTLREVTRPALAAGAARSGRRPRATSRSTPARSSRPGANRGASSRPRARSSARRSPSCTRRPPTGPRSSTTAGATSASSCTASRARAPGARCAGW